MGHADHYEQAERLLYAAEQAARDAGAHLAADRRATAELLLRRAEVLARLAGARAQLAWVAYMGADADADRAPGDAQMTPRTKNGLGRVSAQAD